MIFETCEILEKLMKKTQNFRVGKVHRKNENFRKIFMGQFLTLKNMVTKFFQNSNFSDFLGIKSEISQCLTDDYLLIYLS